MVLSKVSARCLDRRQPLRSPITYSSRVHIGDPVKKEPDIVGALVAFAQRGRFEHIPERDRALAKLHIIDGVGAILAGTGMPAMRALQRSFAAESGTAEMIGAKCATNPSCAAFVNALSARLFDYDDVQTTETSIYGLLAHPTTPVLAAAFAVGQARNVSGTALLGAYLVGVEATARLADAVKPKSLLDGLAPTATFGGIGAALAAARLLELGPKQMRAALAIWETMAIRHGSAADTTPIIALRDAHSVRAAVEAVLLVADGFAVDATPPPSAIAALPAATVKNLGRPYSIQRPGFAIRVYPCHPLIHPALDLALAIVNLHDIRATAIERIDIGITRAMAGVLSLKAPTGVVELRRNLPFAVSLAAGRGVVTPGDFNRLPKAKAVCELIDRVRCRVDPALDTLGHERAHTVLRVTLKNGRVIEMKADVAKGTPQKPLSEIELFHKFFQCALPALGEERAERLLNRLWLLDEVPHVAGLCQLDNRWPTDVEPGTGGYRRHDYDHDEAHGRGHHAHLGHDGHDHDHSHRHDTRRRHARRDPR
jgi:2-methylcitrate dehydratase PrpD